MNPIKSENLADSHQALIDYLRNRFKSKYF